MAGSWSQFGGSGNMADVEAGTRWLRLRRAPTGYGKKMARGPLDPGESLRGRLHHITAAIERSKSVEDVGAPIHTMAIKLIRNGALKDALSGTWLGHPLHPLLVAIPIGSWVGASVLDITPGDNSAATRRLVGLGILSAMPAVLAGVSDWSDTSGAEQRVGAVHLGLNLAALTLYAGSWIQRRKSDGAGMLLALAGGALMGAAGYLGGHLAYGLGVGTDTNSFQTGPQEWQPLCDETLVKDGVPHAVSAAGVSLLVLEQEGRIHVLANRCTHRGAPLSEGELDRTCITCPWHGSVFYLESGEIRRGPATQPQPVYEVRVVDGSIEVRRVEPRSLRTNSVGV